MNDQTPQHTYPDNKTQHKPQIYEKRGFTLTFSFKCQTKKQKGGDKNIVITLFLSKIVIKDWLLLWQDRA